MPLIQTWKKCALYTNAYGKQKTSAEEEKLRQKKKNSVSYAYIFIYFGTI